MANYEFLSNLVGGLESAAKGYMTGQNFAMQRQKMLQDEEARQFEQVLKNKQIQLEEAKLNLEYAKLPLEQEKLKVEAEKARLGKMPDATKTVPFGAAVKMAGQTNAPDWLKAKVTTMQEQGAKDTDPFVLDEMTIKSQENVWTSDTKKLEMQAKRQEMQTKSNEELSKKNFDNIVAIRDDFTKNPQVKAYNSMLDAASGALARSFDKKGNFIDFDTRIKSGDSVFLGDIQTMAKALAIATDPNSSVKEGEEIRASMANMGLADKVQAWAAGNLTSKPTKEQYNSLVSLISKYAGVARESYKTIAQAYADRLNSDTNLLGQISAPNKDANVPFVNQGRVSAEYFMAPSGGLKNVKDWNLEGMSQKVNKPTSTKKEIIVSGGKGSPQNNQQEKLTVSTPKGTFKMTKEQWKQYEGREGFALVGGSSKRGK